MTNLHIARQLLTRLAEHGLQAAANGDAVKVTGPPNSMTPELAEAIRLNKCALLALLRLPPGWPADVPPPPNWPALRAMDWLEVLKAKPARCPECGFGAAILWRRADDPLPHWSCPACSATLPTRAEEAEAFSVAELLEHVEFDEADLPEADTPQHPPEWAEAHELTRRWRAARERLIELLRAEGERRGWPSVRLAPWAHLLAGRENWEAFLSCPVHGPDEYDRLLEALRGGGLADTHHQPTKG